MMFYFPQGETEGQKQALSRFYELLEKPVAVRVGETTVVSTKVHMQDVSQPHEISAIINADAGEVFYQRSKPNEVVHVDVFHSEGTVNPKQVALSIMGAINTHSETLTGQPAPPIQTFVPYIDIQTALGGGRLDGPLTFGQEQGVRKAHITHVHLAMLNIHALVSRIFTIVAAVESAIETSGLELRKVQKVTMARGHTPMDLSDYRTSSDSFLKQTPADPQLTQKSKGSWYREEALARQAARDIGSTQDALNILEALSQGMRPGDLTKFKTSTGRTPGEIRQALHRSNLIQFDRQLYKLTDEGEIALCHLRKHSMEIEAYLRRLLWSLPAQSMPKAERSGSKLRPGTARSRGYALPKAVGDIPGNLAIAESIIAKGISPGPLAPQHLRYWYMRERKSRPIILLLDASASMSGKRMASAKEFARHLIVTGKEKICVVIFQDSNVEVVCSFTKNPRKLEAGIAKIRAQGLTPLAKGLVKVGEICRKTVNKPLVLCVTDGIPTVPYKTLSPIDDAVNAARNLARRGIRLGCIGLEPNHSFLKQMMQAANGALYTIDELEASTMAAIARKEQSE